MGHETGKTVITVVSRSSIWKNERDKIAVFQAIKSGCGVFDDNSSNTPDEPKESGDRALTRRLGNSDSPNSRSDGERGEGLAANRKGYSGSNGQLQTDEVIEAELVDQVREQVHQMMSVTRVGPIPDPRELKEYEAIQEGLADRIVRMAEKSSDAANYATHSNAEVNIALADSIRTKGHSIARGQWISFAIANVFLICAVVVQLFGKTQASYNWISALMSIFSALSFIGAILIPKLGTDCIPASNEDAEK